MPGTSQVIMLEIFDITRHQKYKMDNCITDSSASWNHSTECQALPRKYDIGGRWGGVLGMVVVAFSRFSGPHHFSSITYVSNRKQSD